MEILNVYMTIGLILLVCGNSYVLWHRVRPFNCSKASDVCAKIEHHTQSHGCWMFDNYALVQVRSFNIMYLLSESVTHP